MTSATWYRIAILCVLWEFIRVNKLTLTDINTLTLKVNTISIFYLWKLDTSKIPSENLLQNRNIVY